MFKPDSLDTYLTQWLKTATDGNVVYNVVYEDAFITDRLIFTCKKCDATAKCGRPTCGENVDYFIQEFVKLHAHRPGHNNPEPPVKGVPFKPLDPNTLSVLDSAQAAAQVEWSNAQIAAQMKKYKEEMEKKTWMTVPKGGVVAGFDTHNGSNFSGQFYPGQVVSVPAPTVGGDLVFIDTYKPPSPVDPTALDGALAGYASYKYKFNTVPGPSYANNFKLTKVETTPEPEPPKPKALKRKEGRRFR